MWLHKKRPALFGTGPLNQNHMKKFMLVLNSCIHPFSRLFADYDLFRLSISLTVKVCIIVKNASQIPQFNNIIHELDKIVSLLPETYPFSETKVALRKSLRKNS